MGTDFKTIAEYIAAQPEAVQERLWEVYKTIAAQLPHGVEERLSWAMPTFFKGVNIVHFAAQKSHVGFYPGAEIVELYSESLVQQGFKTTKGGIQLPYAKPLPKKLIEDILKKRLQLIAEEQAEKEVKKEKAKATAKEAKKAKQAKEI